MPVCRALGERVAQTVSLRGPDKLCPTVVELSFEAWVRSTKMKRPMSFTVPSFAKINWTLEVLGRRADGYHELRTLLQTVSLADSLSFSPADDGIELICDAPGVPLDDTNLIVRAARWLKEATGFTGGARIKLDKRIPIGAGLGGGSSNAAVTLLALQYLWGVKLSPGELFQLGARLGADVPGFFLGGTCIGIGRGDEVYPLADISFGELLLVKPDFGVSTGEVYGSLPDELTKPFSLDMMPFSLEAAYRSTFAPGKTLPLLRNDLERSVFVRYPQLSEIKDRLTRTGACAAMMSGSGSTIFALFDSKAMLSVARQEFSDTGWWSAPVRTIGRAEYRAALGVFA